MRQSILAFEIVLVLIVGSGCLGSSAASHKTSALADQAFDLGDLLVSEEDKQPIEHTFQIHNPLSRPLHLEVGTVSCGCTHATLDCSELEAGKSAQLRVSVAASNATGQKRMQVTVKSDAPERESITFDLIWTAYSRLTAVNSTPIPITVPVSGEVHSTIEFLSFRESKSEEVPLRIRSTNPLVCILEVIPEQTVPVPNAIELSQQRFKVEIVTRHPIEDSFPASELGWLEASLDGHYSCRQALRIEYSRPVTAVPQHLFLRPSKDSLAALVVLNAAQPFRILDVSVEPSEWKMKCSKPANAATTHEFEIQIDSASVSHRVMNGRLLLRLDHPEQTKVSLPVLGYRPSDQP